MTRINDFNRAQLANGKLNIDHITELVTSFQEKNNLKVDGAAGDGETIPAIIRSMTARMASGTIPDGLEDAVQIVLAEADRLWRLDVVDSLKDKRSCQIIDMLIRSASGIGWTWEPFYAGNFEWCGTFAAACWAQAGIPLETRHIYFSSTYRLDRWARYQEVSNHKNQKPVNGPHRIIIDLDENSTVQSLNGFVPRAGDILLVGPKGTAYGKHITIVQKFDNTTGVFYTYEGNGGGVGPRNDQRQGIVRAGRPLGMGRFAAKYHARRLIRPAPHDLTAAKPTRIGVVSG